MTQIPFSFHHMVGRFTIAAMLSGALVVLSGCAKFASSASFSSSISLVSSSISSDVLSSPFRSSSRPSSSQEQEEMQEEIEIYTAFWLSSDAHNNVELQLALTTIAAQRGISDWAAQPAVWLAMGRGLAVSGVSVGAARRFALTWSGGDPDIVELLARGYSLGGLRRAIA